MTTHVSSSSLLQSHMNSASRASLGTCAFITDIVEGQQAEGEEVV